MTDISNEGSLQCGCRDGMRSSDIQKELRVQLLLLHDERSQLSWYRHLIRMPPFGSVPGTFRLGGDHEANPEHQELEGLYYPSALGRPLDPLGRAYIMGYLT